MFHALNRIIKSRLGVGGGSGTSFKAGRWLEFADLSGVYRVLCTRGMTYDT